MDFRISDEQRMLDDSAAKFLAGQYTFSTFRAQLDAGVAFDEKRWQAIAELGWLALPFPEAVGGFGGNLVDIQLIARRLGERLCTDPWLSCAVLPGKVLEFAGTPAATALLAQIVTGETRAALAASEANSHYDIERISARAVAAASGAVMLNGTKSVVFGAQYAQVILVTARDENGGALLVAVPADAKGLAATHYRVLDGSRASEIILKDVSVPAAAILARGDAALEAVRSAIDIGNAAICADLLGSVGAMLQKTQEYARTRKQFGAAIGSFQVIQHYLVDMFIEVQQSESLVWMAGIRGDTADRNEREKSVSTAKAYVARAAVQVAQKAVQIHGGIGVTEDLDIGHYFRRVTHYAQLHGDRECHVQRYMRVTQ